jgi:hypothetical protein
VPEKNWKKSYSDDSVRRKKKQAPVSPFEVEGWSDIF